MLKRRPARFCLNGSGRDCFQPFVPVFLFSLFLFRRAAGVPQTTYHKC